MTDILRAVKGMNDILPPESARWEWFEDRIRALMRRYAYRNVRTPIVEPTALFVRGLGEVTDIVEKEMFYDNGIPLEERSGSGIFWCNQTYNCLGPDNSMVSTEECGPERSCYER